MENELNSEQHYKFIKVSVCLLKQIKSQKMDILDIEYWNSHNLRNLTELTNMLLNTEQYIWYPHGNPADISYITYHSFVSFIQVEVKASRQGTEVPGWTAFSWKYTKYNILVNKQLNINNNIYNKLNTHSYNNIIWHFVVYVNYIMDMMT